MARQYALDTETTGLNSKDGDRIIELAIVEIGRDPNPRHLNLFFNPGEREVHPDAFKVHGINNEMLADKPSFQDCIPQILEFLEDDAELIIHNAPFDLEFLRNEFILAGQLWPDFKVIDTLKEAIKHFPNSRHSLDALCNRFGIDLSSRNKHGALIDTTLLGKVYLAWFGQGGFDLGINPADVAKDDISALGDMNTVLVPFNQAATVQNPPSKKWVSFFEMHPLEE